MVRVSFKSNIILALLTAGLVCFCGTQATGQTPEEPEPPEVEVTATPAFITVLVEQTELTPDQVEQMRTSGAGWGNIMIATRLAERIAANSPEGDDKLTFGQALTIVLEQRSQGKGFGQIANENDLKVGVVLEGEDSPNGSSRPRFIAELVEKTDLTQDQVDQMRGDGAGWGNIMIATRLAERIAADSPEDDKLTFAQALDLVLEARADDIGFGEIAKQHDLKVGKLVSGGKKVMVSDPEAPAQEGTLLRSQVRAEREVKIKKQGMFGRLFGMFRSGRTVGVNKPPKPERPERPNRPEKIDKPERPNKPEKFERPERPVKPEKPEKPERPPKPEKPEKPERGPRR